MKAQPFHSNVQNKTASQLFFSRQASAALESESTAEPASFFSPAPFIQAKLTIGAPDDPYEREADQVADQVVRRMATPVADQGQKEKPPTIQRLPISVQRKCAACEEEQKVQKQKEEPEGIEDSIQRKPIFESGGDAEHLATLNPADMVIQRKCAACENEENGPVQRKPDGSREMTATPDIASRLSASKGSGAPLPDSVQSSMGGVLGADLSRVRVHTDSKSEHLNQALGAQAFTYGSDVYFGAGMFAPGTGHGDRLLAHELVHVGQQTGVTQPTIQRHQAGETGHGGIERRGLASAGFSKKATSQVYLGNWMRDFSQFPKSTFPLVNILVLGEFGREITEQELGTYIPSEHLDNPQGGKTIEDKAFADKNSADPDKKKNFYNLYAQLSPDQKRAYWNAQIDAQKIAASAAKNRLPAYIERGKMRCKNKLTEAIKKGENPEGRKEMGNALHAVEDYFAHSNFTEAAILILARNYPKDEKVKLLVNKANKNILSLNLAATLNKKGKGATQIVTGSYVEGANKTVSLVETILTEIETGQLQVAFVKGLLRKSQITAEMIGQRIAEIVGAPIKPIAGFTGGSIGAIMDGTKAAAKGAAKGREMGDSFGNEIAKEGVAAGQKIGEGIGGSLPILLGTPGKLIPQGVGQKVGGAIGGSLASLLGAGGRIISQGIGAMAGGIVEGSKGAASGYRKGQEKGEKIGEAILRRYGHLIGIQVFAGGRLLLSPAGAAFLLLAYPEIQRLKRMVLALAKLGLKEIIIQNQTKKSAAEAKAAEVPGPTHSELAKDDPDNALFEISSALAEEAVRHFGLTMKRTWALNKGRSANTYPIGVSDVTKLVDKYVSHPESGRWWEPIVLAHAATKK